MISNRSSNSSKLLIRKIEKSRISSVRGSVSEVPRVQIFLDTHLNKAINQIKTNNKKRTQFQTPKSNLQPNKQINPILQQQIRLKEQTILLPNYIVMKYIKEVYNKYQIKDPLENDEFIQQDKLKDVLVTDKQIQIKLKDQTNQSQNKRNSIVFKNQYSNSEMKNFLTEKKQKRGSISQKKIIELKNKFKKQIQMDYEEENTIKKINYGLYCSGEPHYVEQETLDFQINSAYTNNQQSKNLSPQQNTNNISSFDQGQTLAIKPKKKLFIRAKPRAISTNPSCQLTVGSPGQISNSYKVQNAIDSGRTHQSKQEQIKQIYRYCLMCEQCILQHNISFHEKKCKVLKMAYLKSLPQLISIVEQKIVKIKSQIFESPLYNLNEDKVNRTRKTVKKWLQTTQKRREQSLFSQYQQVQKQIKNNYLESCELINKLNWFLRLRKSMLERRQL